MGTSLGNICYRLYKLCLILIVGFLALSIGGGFAIFHFSNAQSNESIVSPIETSNQNLISLDNPPEGTVYICPEATSLEEVFKR